LSKIIFAILLNKNLSRIYLFALIFAKNKGMETTKKMTGIFWVLFLISVAAFFFVYKIGGGYCSLVLPFNTTFLAKALDIM